MFCWSVNLLDFARERLHERLDLRAHTHSAWPSDWILLMQLRNWILFNWLILSLQFLIVFVLMDFRRTSYGAYTFPVTWEVIFSMITFISVFCVPAVAIINIITCKEPGNLFQVRAPSDAILRHKPGPTLAQAMAWWLTAPNHYLNQCWLFISKVP